MIFLDWLTWKNHEWEDQKGHQRSVNCSISPSRMTFASMSTHTAELSQKQVLCFEYICKGANSNTFQEIFSMLRRLLIFISLLLNFGCAGKKCSKAPKIQRLVTPLTLQRKRARIADKKKRIAKAKSEAAEYQKLLATRLKEQRDRRSESLAKKRSRLSAASKPSVAA